MDSDFVPRQKIETFRFESKDRSEDPAPAAYLSNDPR